MKLNNILFFNTLILGTLITISSISWFSMWMGLEINLLSFIPLISSYSMSSSEAMMKYFFVQMISSMLILFSILLTLLKSEFFQISNLWIMTIMNSALFMKMGMAPFHFWFIELIEALSWMMSLILLTWQKIAPMIILLYNKMNLTFMYSIIIISMLISGIMSWNQVSMKKILAYSSINHMSWMMSIILMNQFMWMIYFFMYSYMNMVMIMMFKMNKIKTINQIMNLKMNKNNKIFFFLSFLSLGGMPPFIGFFPKWLTLSILMKNELFFLSILMIFFTLMLLFIYLRILIQSLLMKNIESKIFFMKNSYLLNFLNFFNIMGLFLITLIMNF